IRHGVNLSTAVVGWPAFMRRLRIICVGLCVAAGCRSCEGPIQMPEAGFRIDGTELDFGRVLEGKVAKKPVHVVSTSVVGLSLTLSVEAPFGVQETLELEGGADVPLDISFVAGT